MFNIAGVTDVGIRRSVNQDHFFAAQARSSVGSIAFACLCDGMGGLSQGEYASSCVVSRFRKWFEEQLCYLTTSQLNPKEIMSQWTALLREQNGALRTYGKIEGISLGTTVNAVLLTEKAYYAVNVGDSRLYELHKICRQVTEDHSFVQEEVKAGRMTKEEARRSEKQNILTRCIGVQEDVAPDFYVGKVIKNSVYMLCSDGFRHCITEEEIFSKLRPGRQKTKEILRENCLSLVALNKERQEKDNITVAAIHYR